MGWKGLYIEAMYLCVILMLLHVMLGSAKKGHLDSKLLVYPFLSWAVLWIAGFYLMDKYAVMFKGVMPEFTVLGMHPSFAPLAIMYFIGGVLTMTVGYYVYKDKWLSTADWEEFKEKIELLNAKKGGE